MHLDDVLKMMFWKIWVVMTKTQVFVRSMRISSTKSTVFNEFFFMRIDTYAKNGTHPWSFGGGGGVGER